MKSHTVMFTFDKETKNTVRYQEKESDGPPVVGTLYLQKWAIRQNGEYPHMVTAKIEVV